MLIAAESDNSGGGKTLKIGKKGKSEKKEGILKKFLGKF